MVQRLPVERFDGTHDAVHGVWSMTRNPERLLIDPSWTFEDAASAAWKAFVGRGIESTGRRNNFLFMWAQMAGKDRALAGLDEFVRVRGGWQEAAYDIGMAETTFKRLRRLFERIPDRGNGSDTFAAQWDVFISHASEDKHDVARPLSRLLEELGVNVWLDENELRLGDSLREKIDHGLANSSYGVVILSRSFFAKDWPRRELNGLLSLEDQRRKVLLPVWHCIDHDYIKSFSPVLADRFAISTDTGLESVAAAIVEVLDAGGLSFERRES